MKQHHLYFTAAILFMVATGLNLARDGFGLKPVLGILFVTALLTWSLHLRRTRR